MIKTLLSLLISLWVVSGFAQQTKTLHVNITRIETMEAPLIIGLYDNEDSFKSKKALDSLHVVPNQESMEVVFKNVVKGQYAIALFQDIDGTGKLTTKEFGIPTEPVGISNYPLPGIPQPPKFKKALFSVEKDTAITIPLMFSKDYEKEFQQHKASEQGAN